MSTWPNHEINGRQSIVIRNKRNGWRAVWWKVDALSSTNDVKTSPVYLWAKTFSGIEIRYCWATVGRCFLQSSGSRTHTDCSFNRRIARWAFKKRNKTKNWIFRYIGFHCFFPNFKRVRQSTTILRSFTIIFTPVSLRLESIIGLWTLFGNV